MGTCHCIASSHSHVKMSACDFALLYNVYQKQNWYLCLRISARNLSTCPNGHIFYSFSYLCIRSRTMQLMHYLSVPCFVSLRQNAFGNETWNEMKWNERKWNEMNPWNHSVTCNKFEKMGFSLEKQLSQVRILMNSCEFSWILVN